MSRVLINHEGSARLSWMHLEANNNHLPCWKLVEKGLRMADYGNSIEEVAARLWLSVCAGEYRPAPEEMQWLATLRVL